MHGWFQRYVDKTGIQLSCYENNVLLISITLKSDGIYDGYHRPDDHTPWIHYKEQKDMEKIWDKQFIKAKSFEKFVHRK